MISSPDSPERPGKPIRARVAQVIELLKPEFGERLSTGVAIREQHGSGEACSREFRRTPWSGR